MSLSFAIEPIDGFRDIKFGDDIEKLKSYQISSFSTNDKIVVATKIDDELTIDGLAVASIEYTFRYGELTMVKIAIKNGVENIKSIINVFEKKYGTFEYNGVAYRLFQDDRSIIIKPDLNVQDVVVFIEDISWLSKN